MRLVTYWGQAHLTQQGKKMSKNKSEVIELMVKAFQDKNKEMAETAGMTAEEIAEHIEQSTPSITFMQDAVYDALANEGIIQS